MRLLAFFNSTKQTRVAHKHLFKHINCNISVYTSLSAHCRKKSHKSQSKYSYLTFLYSLGLFMSIQHALLLPQSHSAARGTLPHFRFRFQRCKGLIFSLSHS